MIREASSKVLRHELGLGDGGVEAGFGRPMVFKLLLGTPVSHGRTPHTTLGSQNVSQGNGSGALVPSSIQELCFASFPDWLLLQLYSE